MNVLFIHNGEYHIQKHGEVKVGITNLNEVDFVAMHLNKKMHEQKVVVSVKTHAMILAKRAEPIAKKMLELEITPHFESVNNNTKWAVCQCSCGKQWLKEWHKECNRNDVCMQCIHSIKVDTAKQTE